MFLKASKAHEAKQSQLPPQNPSAARTDLAKQLFPSSSPSHASHADIREAMKKPVFARMGSSREPHNAFKPAPAPAAPSVKPKSALEHISGNSASQFKHEPAVIDLTGPSSSKTSQGVHDAVFFDEDDFSDTDLLDLEILAPTALPIPPNIQQPLVSRASVPVASSQDFKIDWSSSPASHFQPPPAARARQSQSLKRMSSGESEASEVMAPAPKKAKKRVLPADFRPSDSETLDDNPPVESRARSAARSSAFWESNPSDLKEQRRQLKNQKPPKQEAQPTEPAGEEQAMKKTTAGEAVPISLSSEQRRVIDLVVERNQSVFFTGPAGTGKSVLMRAIIQELHRKYAHDRERIAVTASTGLAACNIGGQTLHSFSGIGLGKEPASVLVKKIRRNPKAKNRWLKTKFLIIDEISMVDGDLFDKLSQIGRILRNDGRPWGGIQLVITGDFFQLPPVPDGPSRVSKFAFDASTWSTSIDHTIGLTQVFRQRDPDFARMLNEMRLGKISDDTVQAFKALARPLKFDDGVDMAELFPTRQQVENSNTGKLRALPGETRRYDAHDAGDEAVREKLLSNMMAPKSLELKINAQVMLIKNLDETLVNGSLGKVIAFSEENTFHMSSDDMGDTAMAKAKRKLAGLGREADEKSSGQKWPVVQFISSTGMPRTILCQPEEWKVELPNGEVQAKRSQLPLILAWALSIHKAQGQTLERVTVNLGRVFEKGQAYVALSRATTQQGLQVLGFDKTKVMAHERVVQFYNQLSNAEDITGNRPTTISDFVDARKGRSS